ncbi:MAG: hypothetical protein ACXVFV_12030 [Mycobacteriales bacterium]
MADDDVQLTDLEVIQRFSLAVRGATASRAEVVAALEADLAHLGAAPSLRAAARPAAAVELEKPPAAKAAAKAAPRAAAKRAPAKASRTRGA